MLRPETLALTALLALLTAVGPLSVDLYLPSLPEIARALDASAAQVQLTLSGFLVCFAFGQIVGPSAVGLIADQFGGLRAGFACSAAVLALAALVAVRQKAIGAG